MIDFHSHILPGIDDGAPDMEHSVEMARELVEHGFHGVVATPHLLPDLERKLEKDTVEAKVAKLRGELESRGVDLDVHPGAEYYMDRSIPELVRLHHPMLGIAGTKYVLVEMPMMQMPPYMGYSSLPSQSDPAEISKAVSYLRPVIAHPERNQDVLMDYKKLLPLREHGYLFQVNLESVVGLAGKRALKVVKKMAADGMVDLIGTDGHSIAGLVRLLPGWKQRVQKVLGRERAGLILEKNPATLMADKLIEVEVAVRKK